ncbi:MAG: helix-turn-helix domain-containing protein [Candidatus Obscuribacterales bacterium]|nr:helix-turn-helix domain-containing protein [Candidatus Obscuribacterales bacterium]
MHKQRPNQTGEAEPPYYFTVNELSEYSRIGINTLYRAMRNRELKHSSVGQKKIIARKDFESWLKKRTKNSTEDFTPTPFSVTTAPTTSQFVL